MDHLPRRLHAFIRSLPPGARILIPGSGTERFEAFASAGHRLTAIDFSLIAVERAKNALPQLNEKIVLGDFFPYDLGTGDFYAVYERTFLCSHRKFLATASNLLKTEPVTDSLPFFAGKEKWQEWQLR